MHAETERPESRARVPYGRPALAALSLTVAALSAPSAAAQSPALLVSTSLDVAADATHPAVDDAALVRVASGAAPIVQLAPGHWQGVAGVVPGDVDGLALLPGADPAQHGSIVFTLQADEGGFADGDVLAIAAGGGFQVVVAEEDVALALGAPGAAIDLDALAYDDVGNLYFSLQADLASSGLGALSDGDVLRLAPDGSASVAFTEAEVQAAFEAATGLTGAVGDVLGLEWQAGEVWVATQGPTSHDGGVIALGALARVVVDEADLGLGGAELDGLCVIDPSAFLARLSFDVDSAAPGDLVTGEIHGGVGGHPIAVAAAGDAGYFATSSFAAGFGALFVDAQDPWLNAVGLQIVVLDGSGSYAQQIELPRGLTGGAGFAGEDGWTFQAIDAVTLEVSAPFRIRL